jgi:hypothetical protein
MMVSSTYRLNRPAYSQPECITQKQNHMKNKEEIRHYLDTQFSPSEDDMVSIVRNDFDRILNSAASCTLITVEGAMPVLAEQLRTELEALHIEGDLDVIVKISYHPASEISFDDLCSLLTVIHEFAPQVNIVWGCGTDAKLAEPDFSILLLIGTSAE